MKVRAITVAILVLEVATSVWAGDMEQLRREFLQPPDSSKPRTWWQWMNGNITREGITADLEAMQRVGLGGAWIFSYNNAPEGPVGFLTPQWLEMARHAGKEANRLGLEFGIHNSDGWNGAGGPWITPELSMKKLVWSETRVHGPAKFDAIVSHPPETLKFYREIALLAFPAPTGETQAVPPQQVQMRSSVPGFYGRALLDGKTDTGVAIPRTTRQETHFIEFEFPAPQTVRSLVVHTEASNLLTPCGALDSVQLLASEDDQQFRPVAIFNTCWLHSQYEEPTITVSFDAVTAKVFRLVLAELPAFAITEVQFLSSPRVHYFELKAGIARINGHGGETFALARPGGPVKDTTYPAGMVIAPEAVINLTDRMAADGRLKWDVPPGDWVLLRMGYTSSGAVMMPATRLGQGLQCDKLNTRGVESHFPNYVGRLAKEFGPLTGRTYAVAETDSWECGLQNWTDDFGQEFRQRRGYDLTPFLPLLVTGRVMGSTEICERVLWDFRRTVADLIREKYYMRFGELCHQTGLCYCGEGTGRQQFFYDPLNYQVPCDIPMGEYWMPDDLRVDNRAAASVAHTYGRTVLVAGEAFTAFPEKARWTADPLAMKPLGDRAFCDGVTMTVFHRYAHQPWLNVVPGMTMGPWGTMFERTLTWWEQGRTWLLYLSRCQHLLRQGKFVGDVCHYIGDDVPTFFGHREDLWLPLPAGYDYDGCNDEILQQFSVRDGRLDLPSGMNYRVLLLPGGRTMRPAAMRKIHVLVREGAVVVGPRPTKSPSLENFPACDEKINRLARDIWGDCDGHAVREHFFGKGRVFWGLSWDEIFAAMKLPMDFTYSAKPAVAELNYIHRRIDDADLYFVANRAMEPVETVCAFRVTGKAPELWHPETGRIERPACFEEADGVTRVPLRFDPAGSVFVVFREAADGKNVIAISPSTAGIELTRGPDGRIEASVAQAGTYELKLRDGSSCKLDVPLVPAAVEIAGPWEVRFQPGRAAPQKITLDKLISWTQHSDSGVKYFSGTATYSKEITIPSELLGQDHLLYLDLGAVKNLAEVKLNDQELGIFWKPPFRIEITAAARSGANRLEVRITNLWVNRLIGDEQYPDDADYSAGGIPGGGLKALPKWLTEGTPRPTPRIAFATWKLWHKNDPLLDSGLLGPVRLIAAMRQFVVSPPF